MGSAGDCYDNALCESFFATDYNTAQQRLSQLMDTYEEILPNVVVPRALMMVQQMTMAYSNFSIADQKRRAERL